MTDPKSVIERHVQAFGAKDGEAEPWSPDAEVIAPSLTVSRTRPGPRLPGWVLGGLPGRAS